MSTKPGISEGKFEFLEDMLLEDSGTDIEAVNRAWKAAGHVGTNSQSYLGKVKAQLGLTWPRGDRDPRRPLP